MGVKIFTSFYPGLTIHPKCIMTKFLSLSQMLKKKRLGRTKQPSLPTDRLDFSTLQPQKPFEPVGPVRGVLPEPCSPVSNIYPTGRCPVGSVAPPVGTKLS